MEDMNVIYSRTYESLKGLYLNSLAMQKRYFETFGENTYYEDNKIAWLKEWCTIRMCCSRQSGHSYSLIKLISEFNLRGAILYPNLMIAKRVEKYFLAMANIKAIELVECANPVFSSVISLERSGSPLVSYSNVNFVAVDCASFMNNTREYHEWRIYELARSHLTKEPFFVIFME